MAKPIFVATHPRACSTAFERVFMTRQDTLKCAHEPFGDAFYYGPERLSGRYEEDEKARLESGFSQSTFRTIFDRCEKEANSEGKRLFIKDIIHYLVPPSKQPAKIAPSLVSFKRGVGTEEQSNGTNGYSNGVHENGTENGTKHAAPFPYPTECEPNNPTVVPKDLLSKFHFTFLIRDPHYSIPSYYRCTIPPLDDVTGFYEFYPSEAGYDEVRRVFEYLCSIGQVGPKVAKSKNGVHGEKQNGDAVTNGAGTEEAAEICVIDADDLLDDPTSILKTYCDSVGIPFEPEMLHWDSDKQHEIACEAFLKWKGFHEDAIDSTELKPRTHKKARKTEAQFDAEWREKYGEKGAKIIRDTVDANMDDYLFMKQWAIKA